MGGAIGVAAAAGMGGAVAAEIRRVNRHVAAGADLILGGGGEVVVDGHAVIEHIAGAGPEGLVGRDFLEVFQDAAFQMVDVLVSLLLEVGGGLFAADTAGAVHGDGDGFVGREVVLQPAREFSERAGGGVLGAVEDADGDFVIVAGIYGDRAGVGDELVPVLRFDVGAGVGGVDRHA